MQPKAQAEMTKFNCEVLCGTELGSSFIPHSDLHLHGPLHTFSSSAYICTYMQQNQLRSGYHYGFM